LEVLGQLKDNIENLLDMSKQQSEITEKCLSLIDEMAVEIRNLKEEVAELKKKVEALEDTKTKVDILSLYGDWVAIFNEQLKVKLGFKPERVIRDISITKSIKKSGHKGMSQETKTQMNNIERTLNNLGMTLSGYKKLLELKQVRNTEFHKDGRQTLLEAKKNLYGTTFPAEIESYQKPLKDLFTALEILYTR